jgi:hypothetical protein
MSDPSNRTKVDPHPVSGHRTPGEIAKDEAGAIGQPDEQTKRVPRETSSGKPAGSRAPLAPGSRRPGRKG